MAPRSRSVRITRGGVLRVVAVGALIAAGVAARLTTGDVTARTPPRTNALNAVACTSRGGCVSVGSMGSIYGVRAPFVVHSSADGGWQTQPISVSGQNSSSVLSGVDCSSIRSCIAVGRRELPTQFFGARAAGGRPLVAQWDGASWRTRTGAAPRGTTDADLNGVSCVGKRCMTVGDYKTRSGSDRTLAESWDGSAWTLHVPPNPRFRENVEDVVLEGVDCTSATSCIAVGHFSYEIEFLGQSISPLIYRWTGTRWRPEKAVSRQESADTELSAVDCPSLARCVAVGFQRRSDRTYATLAEIRRGNTWHLLPTPNPPALRGAELSDVACPRPDRCVAVGSSVSRTGFTALVESWDGTTWKIEGTPVPPDSTSSALTGVDCAGPTTCSATGISLHRSPIGRAFSLRWDGARWTIVPVPGPRTN